MLQVIEQTREEKIAMYMKLTKQEIAGMLVNANSALESALRHVQPGYAREPRCAACQGEGGSNLGGHWTTCGVCNGKGF